MDMNKYDCIIVGMVLTFFLLSTALGIAESLYQEKMKLENQNVHAR